MKAAAFVLATLVTLPYACLALAFVLAGKAISAGSMFSVLDTVARQAAWMIPWGAIAIVIGTIALAALGAGHQYRKAGAITLGALAVASVITIGVFSSRRIGLPELVFLSPCIAVAVFSAWVAVAD